MANRCFIQPINILPDISSGSSVSIVINKMVKYLLSAVAIALVGCASQPEQPYQPTDLTNFVAACQYSNGKPAAHDKINYLNRLVDEYLEYHKTHPITIEDRRYYGRLKNYIWSMRSTCATQYL